MYRISEMECGGSELSVRCFGSRPSFSLAVPKQVSIVQRSPATPASSASVVSVGAQTT